MTDKRNFAARKDIETGTLRQRRDLYAVSIALLLYYLAGGTLQPTLSLSLLPLHFDSPCTFLYAAWVAFGYFLIRSRLLAPSAVEEFIKDVLWQAGHTSIGKEVARISVKSHRPDEVQRLENALPSCSAQLTYMNSQPRVILTLLRRSADDISPRIPHDLVVPVPEEALGLFHRARMYGFFFAIFRERAFTDYLLPYVFAACTVLIALWSSARASHCPCSIW